MAGIVLENVSRVFSGGLRAVDRFDLEVLDGECLVLVGPSGCGKSTTLRLIAGLDQPTTGTIRIGGRTVDGSPPKDRNIAMVFQGHVLYPHWTVYRNLAFGLELREPIGWLKRVLCRVFQPARAAMWTERRAARDARIRQVARWMRVEDLLDRFPSGLSGGERQRVALGRAVARQPAAFLFDEPLSNLDAALRVQLRMELKRLQRELNTTMVWVTHDQTEALTLGDRVAVMDRGRLQQVASPWNVYARPANRFVAGFVGSPPMNLLDGEWLRTETGHGFRHADWWLPFENLMKHKCAKDEGSNHDKASENWREPPAGRVVLGLRAEDLHLPEEGSPPAGHRNCRNGQEASLPARVVAVESLGDSSLVHLEPDADLPERAQPCQEGDAPLPLICKASARPRWVRGDRVQVQVDLRRAHFFDSQTGVNLSESP